MSACRISRPAKSAAIDFLQISDDLKAFNEAELAYNARCCREPLQTTVQRPSAENGQSPSNIDFPLTASCLHDGLAIGPYSSAVFAMLEP